MKKKTIIAALACYAENLQADLELANADIASLKAKLQRYYDAEEKTVGPAGVVATEPAQDFWGASMARKAYREVADCHFAGKDTFDTTALRQILMKDSLKETHSIDSESIRFTYIDGSFVDLFLRSSRPRRLVLENGKHGIHFDVAAMSEVKQ